MSVRKPETVELLKISRMLLSELQSNGYTYKKIGRIIGVSDRSIEKYMSGESTMTLSSFFLLLEETKPTKVMKYLCGLTDGIYVQVPEFHGEVHEALSGVAELGKEFTEVVAKVSAAVDPAGDGGRDITIEEAKAILQEQKEMMDKNLKLQKFMEAIINGKS
jgi:transcriptional regulator with XRE-family HTH domain